MSAILESEVKSLLNNKVVSLDDVIFYAAKALNSGKDADEKIALFREGKRKVTEPTSGDHDPAMTALGYVLSKSKLKISGLHKITAVKDCDALEIPALLSEASANGYELDKIEPSSVNAGKMSVFVKKTFE